MPRRPPSSPAPASAAACRPAAACPPLAVVLLCLPLLLAGCASPGPAAPAEPADAAAAEAPADPAADAETAPPEAPATGTRDTETPTAQAPSSADALPDGPPSRVRCFFGTIVQQQPDGSQQPTGELLLRRSDYRDAAVVMEDSVRYDRGPRPRVSHYRVRMDVDPDTGAFTLRETGGLYAGRGELEGAPWGWDAWTFRYQLTSGITVTGRYELRQEEGEPVLHGEKQAYGPDGGLALTLLETLPEADPAECEGRIIEARAAEAVR